MKQKSKSIATEETPHDMMKRVFAVAELLVRSDGYRQAEMRSANAQKHKSEELMYCKNQNDRLGTTDGTEET